jgi:hypothetical protein
MPLPTINDVQAVEPILQNLLVSYMQADNRFVSNRVFPAVPVDKDSGTFYKFTKKYWFLDEMQQRAPGDPYARGGAGVETDTYATVQWALSYPIADEVRANSQLPLSLETAAVQWLAQQALIRKERAFAADFMAASVWDNEDNNTAVDWDDTVSGNPINDVLTAKRTISNNTGYDPNTMVVGYIVHQALMTHPDIVDRVKYTQLADNSNIDNALSAVFGLQNYMVARATYNSANEAATFSASAIIDDDALICYVNPAPGIMSASAGYTFAWAPGGGIGSMRPTFRDEANDTDLLKFKMQWDQKAVAADLGYIFLDIV